MNRRYRAFQHLAPWILIAVPSAAWANVGVPMLVLAWPAYVLGLVPIIAIESFVGTKDLRLSWRTALPVVTIANLWSTFLGIPITWAAMLVLEFGVGAGTSAVGVPDEIQKWLFPFYVAWVGDSVWAVYAAFLILAIPFCVVSIWIESRVALRKLPEYPPDKVRAWVKRSNIWSYCFMVVCAIAFPMAAG